MTNNRPDQGIEDLERAVSDALVANLPPEWAELRLTFRGSSTICQLSLSGSTSTGEQPAEVDKIFWRLRVGMYREGHGTWFSSFFRMRLPGTYEVFCNWDNEPRWTAAAESFAKDREMFPRSDERTPDWFRQRFG